MATLDPRYLPEQIRQLHKQALGAFVATVVGLAYIVYTISEEMDATVLWMWVGAILSLNAYLLVWVFLINQRGITQGNAKVWLNLYLIQATLHGLAWSVLPIFVANANDPELRLFAYFVLFGMSAASVSVTAIVYRVYAIHVVVMLLPGILYQIFGMSQYPLADSVIALLMVFLLAMLSLAYSHNQSILKSISLAFKNDELVENLKLAYKEAEEANLAKSRFLANMSHELRTPLNAVIGYSEIISEEAKDSGSADISEDSRKITNAGRQLLSLIDDILNLSRIEAGKMNISLESFDLDDLLLRMQPMMESLANEKNNRLELEVETGLGDMLSDEYKVKQILVYLFTNAAKFTENGVIRFSVQSCQLDGAAAVQVIIADTGIGMSAEQLSMLFDAFRQADDSTTRKYGGMGMGMAITRNYVHMLGGRIAVESTEGEGSRFQVQLPLRIGSVDPQPGQSPQQ